MHPNGQLPAYEWNFGDVNPPVHALAALAVFELDGARDRDWLARVFHKLLLDFTWWASVKDPEGDALFGGGFLGMDNVGPFDRSAPLPEGETLEQADGTGWMALYCLSMLEIALILAAEDSSYEDVAVKFFGHFTLIARAINDRGLWDEADGFYYDRVRRRSDGEVWPVRVRSMTGLIPLCAVAVAADVSDRLPEFSARVAEFLEARPEYRASVQRTDGEIMLAMVGEDRLPRILERLADETEFLSPFGLRSLSAVYRDHPFEFWGSGEIAATVDYEPAESTTDDLRRQLELAGADLVPGQLPGHRRPRALRAAVRRRAAHRVPARLGAAAHARRDHRRAGGAPRVDLPRGRRRSPPRVRRARALPARPRVA